MNGYSRYQENTVGNARPEDLLLQMVEGAIRNLKGARTLWAEGDKVAARERLSRALALVMELDNTLDREAEDGRELVDNLEALYAYAERELIQANRSGEFERLGPVQEVLETLYQGWREAVSQVKQAAAEADQPASAASSG
jgi:flagellar protein FliS